MALVHLRCQVVGPADQTGVVDSLQITWAPEFGAGTSLQTRAGVQPQKGNTTLTPLARSRDYYFRIQNLGQRVLRDVVINVSTDHNGVSVYPTHFDKIEPANEALAPTFVRLVVEHGPWPHEYLQKTEVKARSAVIGEPVLKADSIAARRVIQEPGVFEATLTVTGAAGGTGTPGGAPGDEIVRADLRVATEVLLTDIIFLDNTGEIDLSNVRQVYASGRAGVPGFVPVYSKSGAVRAVNVGTVQADLRFLAKRLDQPFTVMPGDTVEVIQAVQSGWIRISPERATVNYNRFHRMTDGNSYVYFSKG